MRRTSLALGTLLLLSRPELAAAQGGAPDRAPAPAAPTEAPAPTSEPADAVAPPPEGTTESAAKSGTVPPPPTAPPESAPRTGEGAGGGRIPFPATSSEEDEAPPNVPPARDTVGDHVSIAAMAGLVIPFGVFGGGQPQTDRIGPGLSLGGDIAYGISRTVMLGAYGEVAMPSTSGDWSGASATTVGAGPLVRYHLVQGVRFDPWVSAGIGFRRTSSGTSSYTGIDWLRLQLGGDWYATSQLGFGPVLELALGTFTGASGETLDTKGVNAHFVLGGRIVFDGPGK
jgi:hypothetical protein